MQRPIPTRLSIPSFALIAFALFLLIAVGGRVILQLQLTGNTGIRLGSRGATERLASSLLVLSVLLAALAPASELLGWVTPVRSFAPRATATLGIAVLGLGFLLTVISQVQMGTAWRIDVDPTEATQLVTPGIFGYVRNPIFTGLLLALTGLLCLVPNILASLALLLALIGLELQVRLVEEPSLLRMHGDSYRAYTRSVGRFVPKLGRRR